MLTWIPGVFLSAHYRRYAPLLVLLVLRGLLEYFRKKKPLLALLHLLWFLPFGAVIARTLVVQAISICLCLLPLPWQRWASQLCWTVFVRAGKMGLDCSFHRHSDRSLFKGETGVALQC